MARTLLDSGVSVIVEANFFRAHYALKLPGDLIELDTTQRVDLDALTDRIRELS